jgi:hypothetical protein
MRWTPDVPLPLRHLLVTVALLLTGAMLSLLLPEGSPASSPVFFATASALLAVGFFASTFSIPRLRRTELGVVLLAVTVGVLLKAALIAVVMFLAFRNPAYLLLGPVMAQIDPLSVAALSGSSRLSERGRAILAAWSSFDDPVTSAVVILAAAVVVRWAPVTDPGAAAALVAPGAGLVGNLALVVTAALAWWGLTRLLPRRDGDGAERPVFTMVAVTVLLVLAAAAVGWFLMLGLAAVGLFFRPAIDLYLQRATAVAFALAALLLGVVAGSGLRLLPGLVLGVTAYLAQVVAAAVVTRRMPRPDRLRLAVAQQSGITAIILALLVEPVFPGSVAVVAPAIVVVNLLHLTVNATLEQVVRRRNRRLRPVLRQTAHVVREPVQRPPDAVESPAPLVVRDL